MFYALALIANASPSDKTHTKQKQAAELLEPLYRAYPQHPRHRSLPDPRLRQLGDGTNGDWRRPGAAILRLPLLRRTPCTCTIAYLHALGIME